MRSRDALEVLPPYVAIAYSPVSEDFWPFAM